MTWGRTLVSITPSVELKSRKFLETFPTSIGRLAYLPVQISVNLDVSFVEAQRVILQMLEQVATLGIFGHHNCGEMPDEIREVIGKIEGGVRKAWGKVTSLDTTVFRYVIWASWLSRNGAGIYEPARNVEYLGPGTPSSLSLPPRVLEVAALYHAVFDAPPDIAEKDRLIAMLKQGKGIEDVIEAYFLPRLEESEEACRAAESRRHERCLA